jgi:hypothetical protein
MAGFAAMRRTHTETLRGKAKCWRYIRIGGNGFRAVSIHPDRPCGSLERDGRTLSVRKSIERALADCDAHPKPVARNPSAGPYKPEHRIQAFLIRHALRNPQEFGSLIRCNDLFDSLEFVTDELRIDDEDVGAIRADMVALGQRGDTWIPVFIELKAGRDLKTVRKQLENIDRAAREFEPQFRELFSSSTGVVPEAIDFSQAMRILIWGMTKSGKESTAVSDARRGGIVTVLWEPVGDEYVFERVF